ncbi:hypothetical protein [Salibacterium sp. K-3]
MEQSNGVPERYTFYIVNHLDALGEEGALQVATRLDMTEAKVLSIYRAHRKADQMAV